LAENRKFFSTLPFSALVRRDCLRIYGKALRLVPETRVFQAANDEDLVILACTVFDWSTRVDRTDRRTDRQKDTQTVATFAR